MFIEPTGTNQAVTGVIRQAARMTGADFQYLLATAQVESNLNPNAQVPTSSAKGLFQFIEQTWLATLKDQGPAFGYGSYANAIVRRPSGDYAVSDPRMNDAIMNLRADPTANSLMAGAFTKANAGKLAARLGRTPTEGELYIAHFLGPTGASRLIGLADTNPLTSAAAMFPGAARANRTIFYDGRGVARGAAAVYQMLVGRYDAARGGPGHGAAVAANAGPNGARNAFAPDTANLTETYAAAARLSPATQAADIAPVFHGLFRSGGGAEPVAPLVSSLWTSPQRPDGAAASAPVASAAGSAAPVQAGGELGLFQDEVPDARALFRGRV